MALDEPKENDKTFTFEELTFLVEDNLMKNCGDIKIDFINAGFRSGFTISSTYPVNTGSACSSSSCGSGGSCSY